jgi:hypothetical protein
MIEIVGLQSENGETDTWRVRWPEPDGSSGSADYESCELAVEFALLIRVLMHIQQGQHYLVVVSDDDSETGHGDAPSRNRADYLRTAGTQTENRSYNHA